MCGTLNPPSPPGLHGTTQDPSFKIKTPRLPVGSLQRDLWGCIGTHGGLGFRVLGYLGTWVLGNSHYITGFGQVYDY